MSTDLKVTAASAAPASASALIFGAASSVATNPSVYTTTGSGNVVLSTSPTLVTPVLGAATATSINKVTVTAPATGSTLTLADGSTLATSGAYSVTFTATNTTALTLPTSGTVTALGNTTTGSGSIVLATSPTLTTPVLGVASATTINKVTITTPATGSTLTILDGKTLTVNNILTLAGTDSTTMTFPATSTTLAGLSVQNTFTAAAPQISLGANSGNLGTLKLFGSTSGDVTVKAAAAAGTATIFQLPATNGTNNYVLSTDGSGVTSWVAQSGSGTVNSGTAGQIAYYATSAAAVSGSAAGTGALTALGNAVNTNGGFVTASTASIASGALLTGGGSATAISAITPGTGVASALAANVNGSGGFITYASFAPTAGKTLTVSNSLTLAGTDSTTMTFPPTSSSIGYLNIPVVGGAAKTTSYTGVLADQGMLVIMNATTLTYTIPANASVAYPLGTVLTIVNTFAGNLSIAITSDTLTLAGSTSTGARTLGQNGVATAIKVGSTSWIINGTGLT